MKYIQKYKNFNLISELYFSQDDVKEKMSHQFKEVFGFDLYNLTDRLLSYEDIGMNFYMSCLVWVKVESNKKYNLNNIMKFPEKSSQIKTYVHELFRYRTESETDDNLEILEYKPLELDDIVAGSIILHSINPYLVSDDNDEKISLFNSEFSKFIEGVKRQFPLLEIEREVTTDSTMVIFKRKED